MSEILITGYNQKPSSYVTDGSKNSLRKVEANLLTTHDVSQEMCSPNLTQREKNIRKVVFSFFFNLL